MSRRSFKAASADGPMLFPALEQYDPAEQRITDDPVAVQMLSPAMRAFAKAMRWKPMRDLLVGSMEKQLPGLRGGMVARKRYADDQVVEALRAGVGQFVVLGAGFDTRALRLIAPAGAKAFEVDLPDNVARKRALVDRAISGAPANVAFIPVDFETDDLGTALADHGFRIGEPAMFVWEAVTQYLTAEAFRATLSYLATAATGSRLIFTFVRKDFLDGTALQGWDRAYRKWVVEDKVWTFGLDPNDIGPTLADFGWTEREQVGTDEYRKRYFLPAGRDLAAIDIERFVYAEKH